MNDSDQPEVNSAVPGSPLQRLQPDAPARRTYARRRKADLVPGVNASMHETLQDEVKQVLANTQLGGIGLNCAREEPAPMCSSLLGPVTAVVYPAGNNPAQFNLGLNCSYDNSQSGAPSQDKESASERFI